jgi:hypothetical protein
VKPPETDPPRSSHPAAPGRERRWQTADDDIPAPAADDPDESAFRRFIRKLGMVATLWTDMRGR